MKNNKLSALPNAGNILYDMTLEELWALFPNYLIAHPNVAKEYEKLKYGLKEKFEHHRDGYTEAKTEFILAQTQAARQAYQTN
jgi:GrpB-like predicted nucleotidyltransferase (UPF0157 family)